MYQSTTIPGKKKIERNKAAYTGKALQSQYLVIGLYHT